MTSTKSLRIYIAGPYTAANDQAIERNVNRAIDAGIALVQKGHYPYVPHLTHFVDRRAKDVGVDLLWEDYLRWDMEWLKLCDAVLFLGNSKGADLELETAMEMGKKIYHALDEVQDCRASSRKSAS